MYPTVPLCLTRTDVHTLLFLVFFPLPSKIHHKKGVLLICKNVSSPTLCSEDAELCRGLVALSYQSTTGSHRISFVLLFWIGFPVFFSTHPACLKQSPVLTFPEQTATIHCAFTPTHPQLYVTIALPTLRGKQSSLRALHFCINHTFETYSYAQCFPVTFFKLFPVFNYLSMSSSNIETV